MHALLKHSTVFNELLTMASGRGQKINVNGIVGSLDHVMIAELLTHKSNGGIIVTATDLRAKKVYEDLSRLSQQEVLYYPKRDLLLGHTFAHSKEIEWERAGILTKVLMDEKVTLVTSVEALGQRLPSPDLWKSYCYELEVGQIKAPDELVEFLVYSGYERTTLTEQPGHFSLRGGLLDIFVPGQEAPLRIEFFDDEIDSIRTYDVVSQKSISPLAQAMVTPASEGLYHQDMAHALEELLGQDHSLEGLERYLSYTSDKVYSLLDYGVADQVFLLEVPELLERYEHLHEEFITRFKSAFERGDVLPGEVENLLRPASLKTSLQKRGFIGLNKLRVTTDAFSYDEEVSMKATGVKEYFGKLDLLIKDIGSFRQRGYKIYLFVEDDQKISALEKAAEQGGINIPLLTDHQRLSSGQVGLVKVALDHGFTLLPTKTLVISEVDLFGQKKRRRVKRFTENSQAIKSFSDLTPGDYIVHERHGIGKYLGIDQIEVDKIKKDYMKISYKNEDILYVPIDQMTSIQKYIGGDVAKVKVHSLGSSEWKKTKSRAKKAIEDMTEELLALYSKRKQQKGYAFRPDTEWQKSFEALFPYEETQDQLKCIEEIKADMEQVMPMDRLLCGDVGYGKTEVAIRAIFKAVMDSKQAAILVPTTILAQQHYTNIKERFSKYPIKVEVLSRFKTKKEQEKVVDALRLGSVDVVIGTHRLLSSDIRFKDLGLLVVDEEQRFGVKHKEKIKQLKTSVDVLTLTATPIPRTLHMSMIGIRDMSLIEDPPEDRYPIQTYITEYEDGQIREGILRELERGGQIYFVYNQVKDIDTMADRLARLVPEARIAYAHGQMNEHKLEKIMLGFLNKEFDILVSTTIIETGLDISNVNTIIIYNADKMGLSQLYQLRGRVGRSNRVAYAYFTYKKNKALTEIAQKRLMAIKEFTELGSGFKIAMRDLEIRGAGNLLGAQQHGQMESIGYELYTKLLEEQMKKLKGQVVKEQLETTIEINIDSFIDQAYISDEHQKMEMYKKISGIESLEDYYSIEEELEDRFGTIPLSVYNLLDISYIRALASMASFSMVKEDREGFVLTFAPEGKVDPQWVIAIGNAYRRRVKIDMGKSPHLLLYYDKGKASIRKEVLYLKVFLEEILDLNTKESKV